MAGDFKNNIYKLRSMLRLVKYPQTVDYQAISRGLPSAYLPVYHYLVLEYSNHFTEKIMGFNLGGISSKNDRRFMQAVYKVARELLSMAVPLTLDQFFADGFVEKKLILCSEIGNRAAELHKRVVSMETKKHAAKALKDKMFARKPFKSIENISDIPVLLVGKEAVDPNVKVQGSVKAKRQLNYAAQSLSNVSVKCHKRIEKHDPAASVASQFQAREDVFLQHPIPAVVKISQPEELCIIDVSPEKEDVSVTSNAVPQPSLTKTSDIECKSAPAQVPTDMSDLSGALQKGNSDAVKLSTSVKKGAPTVLDTNVVNPAKVGHQLETIQRTLLQLTARVDLMKNRQVLLEQELTKATSVNTARHAQSYPDPCAPPIGLNGPPESNCTAQGDSFVKEVSVGLNTVRSSDKLHMNEKVNPKYMQHVVTSTKTHSGTPQKTSDKTRAQHLHTDKGELSESSGQNDHVTLTGDFLHVPTLGTARVSETNMVETGVDKATPSHDQGTQRAVSVKCSNIERLIRETKLLLTQNCGQ